MPPPSTTPDDVIVIGAGLSGLTTALVLQQAGHQVRVFERLDQVGGLCGTKVLDGYEFTIGCNDFGAAFARTMRELGVDVEFTGARSIFQMARRRYRLPLRAATAPDFLRHVPDLVRLVAAVRAARDDEKATVHDLLRGVRRRDFADLIASICWALGTAPRDMSVQSFTALFAKEHHYGYDHPVVPVGGPQVLADRMAGRLTDLGGIITLNTEVTGVDSHADGAGPKVVKTASETYQARHVVSSEPRLDLYPQTAKPSLAIAVLHLATKNAAPFPSDLHTLACMPPNVEAWLSRLDDGEYVAEPGFNLFPCEFADHRPYRAFNAYLMCPRGTEDFEPGQIEELERHVLRQADRVFPGFSSTVLHRRFLSPSDYRQLHGLSSTVTPAVPPPGFRKPEGHDQGSGIHHVGNSVQPPGEHAGGAIASALRAAALITTESSPVPSREAHGQEP